MEFTMIKESETAKRTDLIELQRGDGDFNSKDFNHPSNITQKLPTPAKNQLQEHIALATGFGSIKQGGDKMKCKFKELQFEGEIEECKKMIEYLKQTNF